MSLLNVLRNAVQIANVVTKPLQATCKYRRHLRSDAYGASEYSGFVELRAIVDYTSKQVRTKEGVLTVTRAVVEFIDIAELKAATNGEGIGNHDEVILPDGDTGPILDLGGFIDAGTGNPIATRVMLG